jgi:serine/threonine protein kinase
MIRAGAYAGPQERARFQIEAEAVASLSHPHIIQILHHGEWEGMPYLVLEFAEGGNLAQRLAGKPLPPAQAAELVETLARAVQFVHDGGLIHRDLKPANVLFTDQGVPKVADFGLAKRLDQDQGLTRTHAVLGTASYMAPEQAKGDKHSLGPAADVYALGAILYEVLTGRPPFRAETHELTIHQVLSEDPLPPTRLSPEVPAELEAVCLKCLEKEPGQRYASALALGEDLRRYRDGQPISIPSFGTFERHARAARRAGYEIQDTLGTTLLGTDYRARHLRLGRVVTLEMMSARGRLDPAQLDRLQALGEARAQLHHTNIVEVYDFGEHNEEIYVAREYVEGVSLADKFTGAAKPAAQTAALVETLARAVHHAHQRGLVHGGLKPSKVLLASDHTPKITGFGMAQILRGDPLMAGPSNYQAPEQRDQPDAAITPAADVYALGAILYELLAGRPPATADACRTAPEPPRHWRPEVPQGLEAVCLKCLEKDPAARYPSAAALAEDLRRFRTGEVLFIDDLDARSQQERWARRAGYEILEVLGVGRDGFTYKARQVALDRVVVLKRIVAADRFEPGVKARFRREAQYLGRLRHPNFVRLYDHGEQNDLTYFAREYVDGPTLAEKAAEAPLPARTAAEWVETLARAVEAAHAHGAIHAGLNPDHVRLTPTDVPKITCFRRASLPGSDADAERPEIETCRLAGYLAPEQLEGRFRSLGTATDVYALGAILYILLTGRPPFSGATLAEVLEQVRSQPLRRGLDIAGELENICLKCLDKQPGRRPVGAGVLAQDLRQFLAC